MTRRPKIAVIGSGNSADRARCELVGAWIARSGFHLVTGGGGGSMEAAGRGFCGVSPREGVSIGVLPGAASNGEPPPGYPNAHVELALRTHLPLSGPQGTRPESRNHIIVLSADVVIALPGGDGTSSEVLLAVQYGVPIVAFLRQPSEIPDLPGSVPVHDDFDEVERFVRDHITPPALTG